MSVLFEIRDKTGRNIRLTKERWKHIVEEHPNITNSDLIERALVCPDKISPSRYQPESVQYYYLYIKRFKRYLMVGVKYLNGEGFIITAYYLRKIR
ncbi:hypothetical protein CMO92_02180 [Candidatus Woesearchaeota archaeon]|nr:hypothetical protein [Candidatus Woesearchaeota archaeon]|tara:strand:+ start:1646 stop:1933 length:288 start_codon:yes stop_codon:yes gene_type:complete